jgi:hypothetical protein
MENGLMSILQDRIPEGIPSLKRLMNVGPIISSYGAMNIRVAAPISGSPP